MHTVNGCVEVFLRLYKEDISDLAISGLENKSDEKCC